MMQSMRAVFRPQPTARCLVALLLLVFALGAGSRTPAEASSADDDLHDCAYKDGALGHGECQHFLKNPSAPTDDPCWCDKCRNGITGQRHDGSTIPKGWNPDLFLRGGLDAYLKRHSVAWGITCSECYRSDKPWPDGKNEKEPGTIPAKDWAGNSAKDTVAKRLMVESRLFKKSDEVAVAYNRHFYFVTDIQPLKVRTPGGSSRVMSQHEWVHLMIERAEFARREWSRNFGPQMTETQSPTIKNPIPRLPVAVFFTESERDFERIGAEYFKNPGNRGLRGSGTSAHMCGGMALSGFGWSKEKLADDHEIHAFMRHRLAHNLMAMWGAWETRPKAIPVWMDEGVAHWLTKSIDKFRNDACFCSGEGQSTTAGASGRAVSAAGFGEKEWDKDVVRFVQTNKLGSIEEMLGKTVISELIEEDQKRAWSYVDICLTEWREPFVKLLRDLRQEKDVRLSFEKNLGCTPEEFDRRWRDRVLGRRKSMAPSAADAGADSDDTPGAHDRKAIRAETDPKVLASRLRSLGDLKDPKTVPVVVDVIAQDMDLPRETALVALLKIKEPVCLQAMWQHGLSHPDPIVRAYVARACGRLGVKDALPKLEEQLADSNWYARAEAAVACGVLKHVKAMAALRKMADSDASEKARVGAMDALALFGKDAAAAVPIAAKALDHAQWQMRITAAQTLREIAGMEAVDPLLARFEKEPTGRTADEVYEALKKITRDDLGRKYQNWKTWWEREKAANPGGLPKPAEEKKPKGPDPNDPRATRDSAPAPYFGVELYCNRVAFVCDTSASMLMLFTPDPSSAKALSRDYVGRDKLSICKSEVAQALGGLDRRAHFNVITFGTRIRSYSNNPVAATSGNVSDCVEWLSNIPGEGETNYYDALKAALDIGDKPDTNPDFKATPDTITFLTDGEPTKGDIKEADVLVEWYTGLNRYARVKTHTITFGLISVDMPLLRGIAEKNGGRFVLVAEMKRQR
jgi:HEAT repeat protein